MRRRRWIWVLGAASVLLLFFTAQPLFAAEKTVKLLILDCG